MASKVNVKWTGDKVVDAWMPKLYMNAEAVGMFVSGKVVKSISTGQPVRKPKRNKARKTRRRRLVGLNPSSPNSPPHVLSGRLRNSINHRVTRRSRHVPTIKIGAYTPYARALEYGNPKGNLEPRPFLRPALYSNRKQILKILARGLFK